jgi:hypothetical protein
LEPIQIEFLFDSIMQDYQLYIYVLGSCEDSGIKINSFMIFLKYVVNIVGNNHERKTKGYKKFQSGY